MADDPALPPPPEGFVEAVGRAPYMMHNGPLFHRVDGDLVQQAFFALDRHANGLGLVHGGMLASLLDGTLARAVGQASGQVTVTMHLSLDYLNMARVGEWLIAEARATRVTRDVGFAEGRVVCGHRDVIRGSGMFKLMRRGPSRT